MLYARLVSLFLFFFFFFLATRQYFQDSLVSVFILKVSYTYTNEFDEQINGWINLCTCSRNPRHDKSKNPSVKKQLGLNYQAIHTCPILSHLVGIASAPRWAWISTVKVTSCYIFTWTLYTLRFALHLYISDYGIGLVLYCQAVALIHYCTLQTEKYLTTTVHNTILWTESIDYFTSNVLPPRPQFHAIP